MPRGPPDGPVVARKFDSMDLRLVNGEAVAHTPQPHIGEAYVGITHSISTMYRGAVPITEHQPADVLEPLRGTGWRGIRTLQRPEAPAASLALRFVPLWGWGVCETAPRFTLYPFLLAQWRHIGYHLTNLYSAYFQVFSKLPRSGFDAPPAHSNRSAV